VRHLDHETLEMQRRTRNPAGAFRTAISEIVVLLRRNRCSRVCELRHVGGALRVRSCEPCVRRSWRCSAGREAGNGDDKHRSYAGFRGAVRLVAAQRPRQGFRSASCPLRGPDPGSDMRADLTLPRPWVRSGRRLFRPGPHGAPAQPLPLVAYHSTIERSPPPS
jgi:hypothetical protein